MILTKRAVERTKAKRSKDQSDALHFDITKHLFPQQLAFVQDPARNKLAVCSRRSGKTVSCAADLVDTATKNPGTVCLYITLSRISAKRIIWREIKMLNRTYKLRGKENLSELSITFPNGSIIYLSGAKDTNEIEKFRGLAIKLVYIDECQSFREYIKELINDVLSPALMDYAGTLCLIGTPAPIPVGYFAECSGMVLDKIKESLQWSKHKWTFFDNPFIINKSKTTHRKMLEHELARRGVSETDPSIQREYYGRWVLDTNSLLVKYDADKNHYIQLPQLPPTAKWNYIMGIDLGFDDADAIAVLAWSEHTPDTYLVDELVTRGQGLTELVEQVNSLSKKYEISKMVIDQGGLGKKVAEEMRRQHHIPVQPADKARKMENVAFLNDALRLGRFRAKSASKFAQDSYLLEIDRDKTTPDRVKVSDKYHSDIIDSVLYAFKESPAFTYQSVKQGPKYGSKEWADQQQSGMWEKAQEHFEELKELEKLQNGGFDD